METNPSSEPSPQSILQIGSGFWASKVLLTAVEFDLFTLLAENQPQTAGQLKKKLNLRCNDRHIYDFLDALTGPGFLDRTGMLDAKKPAYVGGVLNLQNGFHDDRHRAGRRVGPHGVGTR